MVANKFTPMERALMEGGHTLPDTEEKYSFFQTLGEARMFKTREQISREGARSLTDHVFVGMLSLFAMSQDYDYAPVAKEYARRTTQFGGFNRPSPGGTDMYQSIYSLMHPELMPGEKSDMLMKKVNISDKKMRAFLSKIAQGNVTTADARSILYRLERELKIQDPKLRAARRLVQDWDKLSTTQQQLATTQLVKHFRINARRSDLMPIFNKFAKEKGLMVSTGIGSRVAATVARKAAAFGAGYLVGKGTMGS